MLGFRAVGQNAGVKARMQGLHASPEHFGESGDVRDIEVGNLGVGQGLRRATRCDQFDAVGRESSGELDQSGLVPHTQ
jgi:hypothetical protein